MMNFSPKLSALAALALVLSCVTLSRADSWQDAKSYNRSILTYSGKASLLGQVTEVVVTFNCDTTAEKDMQGTLGLDIGIKGTDLLAEFPFGDFEGPDAESSPMVAAVITRTGAAPFEVSTIASGWFSDASTFTFGVSEVSKKAKSPPRALLEALAAPGVESLRLVISDPRPSGKSLTLDIPVAGREEAFRKLLEGLGS
jgi:hypothetical protein